MKHCPSCGRGHSGMCGIPSSVARRAPAREAARVASPSIQVSGKDSVLNGLLEWGQKEKEKVLERFRALSPNMEEYDQLVERLDKLELTIRQTIQQIADKRGI